MSLVVFGHGYTAEAFIRRVRGRFDRVVATARSREKTVRLAEAGLVGRLFPDPDGASALRADIAAAEAVLVSVPPGPDGDPVLARLSDAIAAAPRLAWIGYLSTVGVYGDHGGGWVDETTEPRPVSRRSHERLAAEGGWLDLGRRSGKPVAIFRLAGIYGPGRSPLQKVLDGTAQRIVKPGQVFNRIHVEDIAAVLEASLARPRAGAIYNVADDEPAPPQDVVTYAAGLAGLPPPPEVAFSEAEMTPMARSFYGENKRVASRLIREELGVTLRYPTYREGLAALVAGRDAAERPDRS
ncbi:SDR family oxidoreductase [Enterovirga aerilata]|uniref:SDR family oxidoreductase n=1 Tax=Enterovirga aerilata TaxID=2730920 RepID=A0A849I108_9HYPH|nr:SDR family oxidoreductase [Enterovirga sp. DB1703]NNM71071.1 SDR family oxidoreductase [Enterovirga sp. DB1703]